MGGGFDCVHFEMQTFLGIAHYRVFEKWFFLGISENQ